MVFNAANILLVAAIDIAGMAVAFPVGIGLALVLGVMLNYWAEPLGNPTLLFAGVGLIVAAMVCAAVAHRARPGQDRAVGVKGLLLSLLSGLLMGSFYRFVAAFDVARLSRSRGRASSGPTRRCCFLPWDCC